MNSIKCVSFTRTFCLLSSSSSVSPVLSFCACCVFCSGATKECAWRTAPVPKVWTEVGVCGLPGKSAAGRAEAEFPLQSDTVTAPGRRRENVDSNEDLATLVLPEYTNIFAFRLELRH